jgi:hypothetical protein
MSFYFDSKCPACGKDIKLHGDDSDGPASAIGAQCENCGACVSQQVECRYEYDLVGVPEVTSSGGGSYGFLYTLRVGEESREVERHRSYKADGIGEACNKMHRFIVHKGWATGECVVDYEVLHGNATVDIYALKQHPLYAYLP